MKCRAFYFLLLAFAVLVGSSFAADSSTAPVLRIEAGMHTAMINNISADAAGRLVLTVSADMTARLWELPSGRLLRVLRPPLGKGDEGGLGLVTGALSPDGTLAAVGGFTNPSGGGKSVYVFDSATGRLVRRLSALPDTITDLAFSAQGRFLAAVLGGGHGLRVWETASGREVGWDTDYCERTSCGVDWHGDDRLVTTCLDGQLRLYGLAGGKLTLQKKNAVKGGREPFSARFNPDGRRIAVGFYDSTAVAVVDGSDLSFVFAPDTAGVDSGNFFKVTWTDGGATLAAGGFFLGKSGETLIRRWPKSGRGRPRDTVAGRSTITDLRSLPGGILFSTGDPAWGVVESGKWELGSRKWLGTPPIADHRDSLESFRVSSDGATVAFGYEQNGKVPARFSLTGRELTQGEAVSNRLPENKGGLKPPLVKGLPVTDWESTTAPKLAGQPLALQRYETSRSLAIVRDTSSFLLGADWSLRSYTAKGQERWNVPVQGAWAVNLADNDRLAVVAYGDGTIRWHRHDDGQELIAFFPHKNKRHWIVWTPAGYYDSSPSGEDLIGWHVNRGADQEADFFPAAKFREQFHRPDVIDLVLKTRNVAEALRQANEARPKKTAEPTGTATTINEKRPPVVELAVGGAGNKIELAAGVPAVTLRYKVRAGAAPTSRLRILIDGRPSLIDGAIPKDDETIAAADIPVPAYDCTLSVIADNRFASSETATLQVVRLGGAKETTKAKPRLSVLAVGINDFLNDAVIKDLPYSVRAATDFADTMRKQEGKLYSEVGTKVLTDKDATAGNILDGFDWLRQQAGPNDIVMVFIATHGGNDSAMHYYFAAHDFDPERLLRTTVSSEEIQRTINNVPGKVIFFLDTCHAGNALNKLSGPSGNVADTNRVTNELASDENGAVVFTASTGRQVSWQSSKWTRGFFTQALVEGLEGKADFFGKGKITVASLEAYVANRVPELFNQAMRDDAEAFRKEGATAQTPGVAKPQTVPDFAIALRAGRKK